MRGLAGQPGAALGARPQIGVGRRRRLIHAAGEVAVKVPAALLRRVLASSPLHHRAPIGRHVIDVEADPLHEIGRHVGDRFEDRHIGRAQEDDLLSAIAGGLHGVASLGEITRRGERLHPGIVRHGSARTEIADTVAPSGRVGAARRLHEFRLIDGAKQGAPDRRIIERRVEMIHPEDADVAGGILNLDLEGAIGAQHGDEIGRRQLPPIHLA